MFTIEIEDGREAPCKPSIFIYIDKITFIISFPFMYIMISVCLRNTEYSVNTVRWMPKQINIYKYAILLIRLCDLIPPIVLSLRHSMRFDQIIWSHIRN